MTLLAFTTHLAFFATLAAVSAVIVWGMTRVGVIDTPVSRSSHTRPTPKGGGVGIVVSSLIGLLILYHVAVNGRLADPYFRGVIIASAGIAVVAFLDDIFYWPASVKLLAQFSAAALAVGSGLTVDTLRLPFVGAVDLGVFGPVGTLAWIVFITNAMNFIDGLNGLAAGVCCIACLCLAAIAAAMGAWFVYFAALILAAGLVGFLPFNFPTARIFMGDVGSQFCGFLLAVLGIAAARFEAVDISAAIVPLMLFGVMFDVIFTLIRRALAGASLTEAHRGHLYQVAHRSGVGAVGITLVHWGFAAWGAVCCAGLIVASSPWKLVWIALVLPPQGAWLLWVRHRAALAGIGRW